MPHTPQGAAEGVNEADGPLSSPALLRLGALDERLALRADPGSEDDLRVVVAAERPGDERHAPAVGAALGAGAGRDDGREPRDLGRHAAIIASGGSDPIPSSLPTAHLRREIFFH